MSGADQRQDSENISKSPALETSRPNCPSSSMEQGRPSGRGASQVRSGVLLEGLAIVDCWRAARLLIAATRRDGLPVPNRLRVLEAVLGAEAGRVMADLGCSDVPTSPAAPSLPLTTWTTKEAATVLGVSERRARALAPRLGGQRVGWSWQLDPVAVATYAERRAA